MQGAWGMSPTTVQMCDALRGACTALDFILHMCICMYICMYEIVAGDGRDCFVSEKDVQVSFL